MTEFDLNLFLTIDGAAESIEDGVLVNTAKRSLELGSPEVDLLTDREKMIYEEGLDRGIVQGVGWALVTVDHCLNEEVLGLADYEGYVYDFENELNKSTRKE